MTPRHGAVIDEGHGPVILCLHGFPQNASVFDELAAILTRGGMRVIRYDQRGYAENQGPGRRRDYTAARLAEDALAVLDERQISSCTVVGHDLGGIVGWELARVAPERLRSLVVVGVPHPGAFLLSLAGLSQLVRSSYFGLAQSTRLTTSLYSPSSSRSRARLFSRLSGLGLQPAHARPYIEHLSVDDRFVAAVRWYQAMPFTPPTSSFFRARTAVQIIWGDADKTTGRLAIRLSRLFASPQGLNVTVINGGTHWLVDDHPAEVADVVTAAQASTLTG